MAVTTPLHDDTQTQDIPINTITVDDLKDVLRKGVDDFKEWPTHVVMVALIYPIVGLFAIRLTAGYDILQMLFPLTSGFALIAPLAALGLYELSRLREQHEEVSWKQAFDVRKNPGIGAVERLGLALVGVFFCWLLAAELIYDGIYGYDTATSLSGFINQIISTPEGWRLIVIGSGVGFLFALGVFCTIVISFPMILDQHVSTRRAVHTSFRAVVANPVTMAVWGMIIVVALIIGSIPLFFGLAFVMPILGHSTWHLYRKVIPHSKVS